MLSVRLARRLTNGHRHDLLSRFRTDAPDTADVVLATPARFLSPRKLTRPNEAIDGMLEVLTTAQDICADLGVTCALRTAPPAQAPRLYLSHHTVDTPVLAALAAQGTTVRHFKAADLPGRTCFDPLGFSGWSSLAQASAADLPLEAIPQSEADATLTAARDTILSRNVSKYAQPDASVALPDRPFVFFALQTIGDLVQRKAYVPMLDALAMVVAAGAAHGHAVVIKRHPRCRSRRVSAALAAHTALPHVSLTAGSIHQILPQAVAMFTVNSGVGAEALIHTTPIHCFGAADYAPAAHQIKDADHLNTAFENLQNRLDPATRARFHHYYRHIYQVERSTRLRPFLTDLIKNATR